MNQELASRLTLHPGDVALGVRGDRFETLLGSCIAIVLTDPMRTVGTMCHIVHSRRLTDDESPSAAYADIALNSMTALLQQHGITARLCEAYVYGGGNMFPQLDIVSDVGEANANWALNTLEDMCVKIIDVDVGGTAYRCLNWTVGFAPPQVVAVPVKDLHAYQSVCG